VRWVVWPMDLWDAFSGWLDQYYNALSVLLALVAVVVALGGAIASLFFSHRARSDLQYDRFLALYAWVERVQGSEPGAVPWKLVILNETKQPVPRWTCTIRPGPAVQGEKPIIVCSTVEGIALPGQFEYRKCFQNQNTSSWKESEIEVDLYFVSARERSYRRQSGGHLKHVAFTWLPWHQDFRAIGVAKNETGTSAGHAPTPVDANLSGEL